LLLRFLSYTTIYTKQHNVFIIYLLEKNLAYI